MRILVVDDASVDDVPRAGKRRRGEDGGREDGCGRGARLHPRRACITRAQVYRK